MEATITADTIEINFVGTDTRSLYWKGTYEAPTKAGDWKWTSKGDTAAMESSLLGSQDATKEFTYTKSDGVSWQTTMMGTTITVKTQKQ
ncbi:hypothetical protein [Bifidobacterium primatium]|nr:hypothetical protein [Bifidobacterium primatium]